MNSKALIKAPIGKYKSPNVFRSVSCTDDNVCIRRAINNATTDSVHSMTISVWFKNQAATNEFNEAAM